MEVSHLSLPDKGALLDFMLNFDIAINLWSCTSLHWIFNTVFISNTNQS